MPTGCTTACGFCGRCTEAWEGPDTTVTPCLGCAADVIIDKDDDSPFHWCEQCDRARAARQEAKRKRFFEGAA